MEELYLNSLNQFEFCCIGVKIVHLFDYYHYYKRK